MQPAIWIFGDVAQRLRRHVIEGVQFAQSMLGKAEPCYVIFSPQTGDDRRNFSKNASFIQKRACVKNICRYTIFVENKIFGAKGEAARE